MKNKNRNLTIIVPAEMASSLSYYPEAKKIFDAFSTSHKRHYIDWVMNAKKVETQQRRLEKMVAMIMGEHELDPEFEKAMHEFFEEYHDALKQLAKL